MISSRYQGGYSKVERKVYVVIHTNLSVAGNCKGDGHIGSRGFIGEYLRNLLVNQVIICDEGSPGGSSHENLMLELAKHLTRKEERVESQSKVRSKRT